MKPKNSLIKYSSLHKPRIESDYKENDSVSINGKPYVIDKVMAVTTIDNKEKVSKTINKEVEIETTTILKNEETVYRLTSIKGNKKIYNGWIRQSEIGENNE